MEKHFTSVEIILIESLYKELIDELSKIESNTITKKAEKAVKITKQYLTRLKELMQPYRFTDNDNEIQYYKYLKPKFYAHLYFYADLYQIEIAKPVGGQRTLIEYFSTEVNLIKLDFQRNSGFYQYLRSGATYLDTHYFLKSSHANDDLSPIGYDYKAANFWSKEKLAEYLNKKIASLEKTPLIFESSKELPKNLTWTDSKTALIELIYAFKAKGSFNHGKATLKDITDYIQHVFSVELPNYSRDFQEILRRKSGYTIYLDGLKENYLKYIDEIENKIRK